MSKFDTHGGYFAPKDYLKVNEGGSHEENPKGGVQIGVDPEGIPNLLEEGEPVYKDYVYSDNIQAEREFLEQNNLPGKYEGKLYSKIADDILTEAEERPLDPISRNGLEVLLGRLADAQEEQKSAKEQRELEEELANLSPEELDQLEAMLAQSEQGQVMPEQVPMEAAPEQMSGPSEPMLAEGMPMMKNGGKISRRFDLGGTVPPGVLLFDPETGRGYFPELGGPNDTIPMGVDENGNLIDSIEPSVVVAYPGKTQAWVDAETHPFKRGVTKAISDFGSDIFDAVNTAAQFTGGPAGVVVNSGNALADIANGDWRSAGGHAGMALLSAVPGLTGLADETVNIAGKIADYQKEAEAARKELEALKKQLEVVKKGGPGSRDVIKSGIEKATERIKLAEKEAARLRKRLPKAGKSGSTATTAEQVTEEVSEQIAEEAVKNAEKRTILDHAWRTAINPLYVGSRIWKSLPGSGWRIPATIGGGLIGGIPATGLWTGIGKGIDGVFNAYKPIEGSSSEGVTPYTGFYSDQVPDPDEVNFDDMPPGALKVFGGKINRANRFGDGGWADFFKLLEEYQGSRGRSRASGKYAIDRNSAYWKNRTAREIEALDNYRAFTEYVKTHPNDPNVLKYFSYLDKGINRDTGARTLLNSDGSLSDDWLNTFNYRRTDGDLGIYHISPEDIAFLTSPKVAATSSVQTVPSQGVAASSVRAAPPANAEDSATQPSNPLELDLTGVESGLGVDENGNAVDSIEPSGVVAYRTQKPQGRPAPAELYPTTPRYAGALGASLLGLYNLFQAPDRYTVSRINPYVPEGRINLQNQVYNPLDQNMVANQMIAQGNATRRALGNSGMGPSTGAAILAADNNLTGNLGTGFIQTWDANNQRRNAVIAANNQAEAQRAQFDFNVDQQRKAGLRDAAVRNAQNDLLLQRLNYEAEGQKYAAVGNQLDQALSALSDIGRENFSANQINNNPALGGYMIDKSGRTVYFPSFAKPASLGGFLKKLKK